MENTPEIEFTESSFQLHEFSFTHLNINVKCEVLKMKDSSFIWIGDERNPQFSDLSLGIKSSYENQPITTKILGTASIDTTSQSVAVRLSRKLNKPVYISYNLPLTNNTFLEEFEKRLNEEIEINSDVF